MHRPDRRKAFTLVQILFTAVIASTMTAVVAPTLRGKQDGTMDDSERNVRQVALAGIMYGADYDDAMPILINGPYRSLQDVKDGVNTRFGEQRTDGWPLLVIPYIKSRRLFVDPTRTDDRGIWSEPARAFGEDGYDYARNTYRNQSRFPMYGVNYLFCSPGRIPQDKLTASNSMDNMIGEAHTFTEADDPAGTVYFTSSKYYGAKQGFFVVNAPGMWQNVGNNKSFVVFSDSAACGADWCYDTDAKKAGPQSATNSAYFDSNHEAPVVFLDGHVKLMSDVAVAAGTDYETALPNDGPKAKSNAGGAHIVDKTSYLWNLTDNYYAPSGG